MRNAPRSQWWTCGGNISTEGGLEACAVGLYVSLPCAQGLGSNPASRHPWCVGCFFLFSVLHVRTHATMLLASHGACASSFIRTCTIFNAAGRVGCHGSYPEVELQVMCVEVEAFNLKVLSQGPNPNLDLRVSWPPEVVCSTDNTLKPCLHPVLTGSVWNARNCNQLL